MDDMHKVYNYITSIKDPYHFISNISVEHRSNNPKRDYLFCNTAQGKHVPVSPERISNMLNKLLIQLEDNLAGERILVIGFAETATLLGSYVADNLSGVTYHLQTTREQSLLTKLGNTNQLIEFSEEHSHATQQLLYGNLKSIDDAGGYTYILFVEDEISTGKTILNFINEFRSIRSNVKYGVASICNWQSDKDKQIYKDNNIDTFCLISGKIKDVNATMGIKSIPIDNHVHGAGESFRDPVIKRMVYNTHREIFTSERCGRQVSKKYFDYYYKDTVNLYNEIATFLGKATNVLVIGTEEFMYIPFLLAKEISSDRCTVHTHSTSRSSIDITNGALKDKVWLHSAYDINRQTYIYNLKKYNKVIILSDTLADKETQDAFLKDLVNMLIIKGNRERDILYVNII